MESREEPCRAMSVLFSAPCVLRGTALARLGRASTSADISRRLTGRHSMSSAAHTAPARILCSYCCSCRNVFVSSSLDPHGGYESYIQDSTLRFFRYLVRLRSRKWPHDVPPHGHAGTGARRRTGHRARRSPAGSAAARSGRGLRQVGGARRATRASGQRGTGCDAHSSLGPSASETSEYSTLSPVHSRE
jgi:hypothetical protein